MMPVKPKNPAVLFTILNDANPDTPPILLLDDSRARLPMFDDRRPIASYGANTITRWFPRA